jgi:ribosome recycling factor
MHMTIADIKKNAETKMGKSIEALKAELQKIRTGRAHPGILDQVHVDYYGSPVPISQVANVSLLDARTISVQPWEKGMGPKIEKAIRESDLGLNPSAQGDLLRVPRSGGVTSPRWFAAPVKMPRWLCATCAARPTSSSSDC